MKWLVADRFRSCCSFVLRGLRSRITSRLSTAHQSPEAEASDTFRDRYLRFINALIAPPMDNNRGGGLYD